MDRLIALNSVPVGSADAAPVTGTPQYATSGNPATSTPATLFPAYQYNAIQEELINVITGAGLTPDRTTNAQVLAAIRALISNVTISPAQITTNQNDYNPASLASATTLRINSNARLNITGIVPGASADGRRLSVHNVGVFPIVFTYQDPASVAANRLAFHVTLGGGQSMELQYDGTSSVWRAKSLPEAPIGSVRDFTGPLPGGYVAIDQNVSRTTFAALFNEIGTVWGAGDGATTFGLFVGAGRVRVAAGTGSVAETVAAASVNTGTSSWAVVSNNKKWITGQPVTVTTTGALPTGLSLATTYFLVRVSPTSIQFASSLANAQNGTVITLSTQGTGNHTVTGVLTARTLGEIGGEEDHAMSITEMLAHVHSSIAGANCASGAFQGGSSSPTGSSGGNAAMNNMQPYSVVNVGIKYV